MTNSFNWSSLLIWRLGLIRRQCLFQVRDVSVDSGLMAFSRVQTFRFDHGDTARYANILSAAYLDTVPAISLRLEIDPDFSIRRDEAGQSQSDAGEKRPKQAAAPVAPSAPMLTVSIDVENTGAVAGDEVVQLYVRSPEDSGDRRIHQEARVVRAHGRTARAVRQGRTADPCEGRLPHIHRRRAAGVLRQHEVHHGRTVRSF